MGPSELARADWLPPMERAWVDAHAEVLRLVFAEFEATGSWPDPVLLERRIRGSGNRADVVKAANSIPPALGRRDYQEPRFLLTLLGLACVEDARKLLERYVATIRLALAVYDDPEQPRIITRDTVRSALAIDGADLDRLSQLLLDVGNPFSGGSTAANGDWTITIDERVVEYDDVYEVDAFIRMLAHVRLAQPRGGVAPSLRPEQLVRSSSFTGAAQAAGATGSLAATLLAIVLAPLPWKVAAAAAVIGSAVVHRRVFGPSGSWSWRAGVVAVAATAGVGAALLSGGPPAGRLSVEAQLGADLRRLAGFRVVYLGTATLRGGTAKSFVVVLRDANVQEHPGGDIPVTPNGQVFVSKSDQLRVYDVRGGRLRLAFRFLPQSAGQVRQLPEGDHPDFRFHVVEQLDINHDGQRELVGEFRRDTLASGPYPVPVVLAWDAETAEYRLSPLVPHAPALERGPAGASSSRTGFTRATVIRDRFSGALLLGHAVDGYRLMLRQPDPLLLGLFTVDEGSTRPTGEVKAWTLDLQSGSIETTECGALNPQRHLLIDLGERAPDEVLSRSLLTRFAPPCGRL